MKRHTYCFPVQQRGVALLMGMMMLLVLTLISVSSMQGSTMQEKMSGNVREANLAFQTAEDVIRQAEVQVEQAAVTGTFAGLSPVTFAASGMGSYDCAGARLLESGDPALWPQPADVHSDRGENRYQVVQMTAVNGRSISCGVSGELDFTGSGNRSSSYLIYGYSDGPSGRANDLVVTTFYYNSD